MNRDKIIEELKEKYPITEIVKFNEFNILEKMEDNPRQKIYFQDILEKEEYIYNKMLEKYDDVKGQVYDFYRFESDRNLQKGEIEQYYLPRHPKIKKIKQLLEKQEIKVKYFKLCVNAIDRMYWSMKNYIDYQK